jgi:opacity protein-like surface antigen
MSIFSRRLGLALALAALCLGGRTAHAQAAPVTYWTPSWPLGFGGNLTAGSNTYGNFPGFNGSGAPGNGYARYNFPNGWFVGGEGGGMGLSSINQGGAFSNFPSLTYQGTQVGYNFQNAPLTIYGGLDTLKYNAGSGGPFAAFDSTSSTLSGYSAHVGVAYQPTPNLSLSLSAGFTQFSPANSDINSLGASPFAFGVRH